MKTRKLKSLVSIIAAISLIFTMLSSALAVSAEDALITVEPVEVGATSVTVTCGATEAKDWIIVVRKGGKDNERLSSGYTYCVANDTIEDKLKQPITAGEYEVILYSKDSYIEVGRYGFTVGNLAEEPILAKETYWSTESIVVNWASVPETVGWIGVYPKDYTDKTKYCDYIERDKGIKFPSGVASRYNGYTWPLDTGDYTLVMYEGSGYTVNSTIDFSLVKPTVTTDKSSVLVCHNDKVTITVSGGLKANKYYNVRLYKAKEGYTPDNSGFGNSGVTYTTPNMIGDATGFTTDENGAGTVTETLHQSVTEPGVYAYTIMDASSNYNTEAIAFIEVKDAATVSLSRTEVPLGANITLALKATAGEQGLEPDTTYKIRLYGAYNGCTGFGSSEVNWDAYKNFEASAKTDVNGVLIARLNGHISKITETGNYAYCIMDSKLDTKARAFFTVTDASNPIPEDVPQITIDKTSITLGSDEELTVTVKNAKELGIESKYYYLRLSKAQDGYTVNDSGFTTGGTTGPYTDGRGVTLDENGSATAVQTIHNDKITEPGIYAYVLFDGWDTIGRVFFEVKKKPGDVNNDGSINILDLINLKKICEEMIDYNASGDVNGDGQVDSLDLVELRRILLAQ